MFELTRREKYLVAAVLAAFLIGAGYKHYRERTALNAVKKVATADAHATDRIQ